jgi:hypothetical protein
LYTLDQRSTLTLTSQQIPEHDHDAAWNRQHLDSALAEAGHWRRSRSKEGARVRAFEEALLEVILEDVLGRVDSQVDGGMLLLLLLRRLVRGHLAGRDQLKLGDATDASWVVSLES